MNKAQNLYLDLEEFIMPRLLDNFCGYDEETQSFNIVLAVKQIIQAKEQECQQLYKKLNAISKTKALKILLRKHLERGTNE